MSDELNSHNSVDSNGSNNSTNSTNSTKRKKKKKKETKTILTRRGYAIIKQHYGFRDIHKSKKLLTVTPFVNENLGIKPNPFPVYLESLNKLYVPRYFGLEHFGEPDKVKITKSRSIDLQFNGTLRENQLKPINAFLKTCEKGTYSSQSYGGILSLPCGYGKCLGYNTPIMMYDGSVKMVQDIKVGDKIMGDDSRPRNVLSLARGKETMYKVIPTKGDSYIVNESHILSLKCSCNKSRYPKGSKVDMSVTDYLSLPKSYHGRAGPLLGYRVPVTFPDKNVDLEPYALGYWLGDGTKRNANITTVESVVIDYFKDYCNKLNIQFKQLSEKRKDKKSITYGISGKIINGKRTENKFLHMLQKYNLISNKHIPVDYKCNSREKQLELLAGIIDSDGYYCDGGYDIIQKRETLLDDIIFVARSLGFAAYKKKCTKGCMYNGKKSMGVYYRTNIHGKGLEEIPVKCIRKKAQSRKQIKDVLSTRIKLEKLEVDDYYGFEIDGNRRFLLGDFTVTHNTICALYLISQIGKKTIIAVHKEFLMEQWIERIQQFLPDARVGIIQQNKVQITNKDIVIAMIQSISMKNYPPDTFDSFGFTIVDECHHISSQVFSRCLPKLGNQYMLGLSATPKRKDGLSKVFHWYLGPMVYQIKNRDIQDVNIHLINFNSDNETYTKTELTNYGKVSMPKIVNNICYYKKRNQFIVKLIKLIVKNPKRKILILSDRREQLRYLHDRIIKKKVCSVGYYVGGMKKKDRKESETKQVMLGTYSMSSEGLDVKELNTIIFASPKSDIVQSIGRMLRMITETIPTAYDIIDSSIGVIQRQSIKRKRFYKTNRYNLLTHDVNDKGGNKVSDLLKEYISTERNSENEKKKRNNFKKQLQTQCFV